MSENPENDVETRLERVLRDAEASILELRAELTRIQSERRQHEEVEKLEEHLAKATVRWSEVKEFLHIMMTELRGVDERGAEERAKESAEVTGEEK